MSKLLQVRLVDGGVLHFDPMVDLHVIHFYPTGEPGVGEPSAVELVIGDDRFLVDEEPSAFVGRLNSRRGGGHWRENGLL